MAKKNVWLGVRRDAGVHWIDTIEDSEWHDDVRAALAKNLARRGVDAVARALLDAEVHAATSKPGKAALKSINERLRRDWTIAERIVATSRATEPHHAVLLDADAQRVHLFRRDVAPRDGVHVPTAPTFRAGEELPSELSLVATIGVDAPEGIATLAALAELVPPPIYKSNAWETVWLAARSDDAQRARLDGSFVQAMFGPAPAKKKKGAPADEPRDFVDAVVAERAKWGKRAPRFLVREATPDELRQLFTLGDREVFHEMASRASAMPRDIVERLVNEVDDEEARVMLARCLDDAALLDTMWQRGPDRIKNAIVWHNASAPLSIFERIFANDADAHTQEMAAHHTANVEAQKLFARHGRAAVRVRVARNEAVHADVLRILADDADEEVRNLALAHPAGPTSAYARILASIDDGVTDRVAALEGDALRALPMLALHDDARVRLGVARNPRCTADVQRLLVIGLGLFGHAHKARPTRAIVRAVAAVPGELDLSVVAAILESGDGPAIETLCARPDAAPPLKAWHAERALPVDARRIAANVEWPPFEARLAGTVWARDDDAEVRDIAAARAAFAFTPLALAD